MRIAEAACPSPPEPVVVEIGPGQGALTNHLAPRCGRLVVIELDSALAAGLREGFDGVEVIEDDVLKVDLASFRQPVIVGNLPYYITSPIFEKVLASPFSRAVFLVQKEVAERAAAAPGTRDFGYLSVLLQLTVRVEILFSVPPGAFSPPPKVDSAVVRFTPRPDTPPVDESLRRFIGHCFHLKRKTLRNNLRPFYDRARIETLPEASLRAEQIPVERFKTLYRELVY